jgi:hypothetical protein
MRREIQNPEFLPTQVRFSTEQSTLVPTSFKKKGDRGQFDLKKALGSVNFLQRDIKTHSIYLFALFFRPPAQLGKQTIVIDRVELDPISRHFSLLAMRVLFLHIMLRDLLTQKCVQKKVTHFG